MEHKKKGRPQGYICAWAACPKHDKELRQMAAEGVSLAEIARRIGTSHHRVAEYMKRNDIPVVRKHSLGSNNPQWRGGRHIDKGGYVLVWQPDHPAGRGHGTYGGYVREHRLVMERHLDRYLTAEEVVHHKDGNKQNNDIANLELFDKNSDHLAETLRGHVPKWTEDGIRRMREACLPALARYRETNPHWTKVKARDSNGKYRKKDGSALPEQTLLFQG